MIGHGIKRRFQIEIREENIQMTAISIILSGKEIHVAAVYYSPEQKIVKQQFFATLADLQRKTLGLGIKANQIKIDNNCNTHSSGKPQNP